MPPGERMPEVVGIVRPSGVTRTAQPRKGTSLEKLPVRHSTTQMFPSASNFEPKAYSW